eukprot:4745941-Prymnesium_polylepis.1
MQTFGAKLATEVLGGWVKSGDFAPPFCSTAIHPTHTTPKGKSPDRHVSQCWDTVYLCASAVAQIDACVAARHAPWISRTTSLSPRRVLRCQGNRQSWRRRGTRDQTCRHHRVASSVPRRARAGRSRLLFGCGARRRMRVRRRPSRA